MNNFSEKVNFIWSIADLIRGLYKRGKYQDVILPLTVLRRVDSVLVPTKEKVLTTYKEFESRVSDRNQLDNILRKESGFAFYNTSPYGFESLLGDAPHLAQNLSNYLAGYSDNMREVLERFDFRNTIVKLDEANLLYLVMEKFKDIDLHPDVVSNLEMGYIFEELIRKFNEASNENPGEHFTPREVVRLMVNLLLMPDQDILSQAGMIATVYDPCCGSGGMLTVAKERIAELNPSTTVYLYGQEVNPETFAVCKSDLYIKSSDGRDAENIAYGSTLSNDQHASRRFDYLIANPPYGYDWKGDKQAVEDEVPKGYNGRFGAGTPRISDGQLLFLQHMLGRMRLPEDGGSRVAIVMNGSPLFTGDAGGGESEIRRWILENDWLDAIIALPEQLFYNTGISTYIWVLTNRKSADRHGKVQLINAGEIYVPMRKSLGSKRREISDDQITEITRLYLDRPDADVSKIFDSTKFGYRKVTVERPLRLNFQASEERIARLEDERAFQNLATSKKRNPAEKAADIAAGEEQQRQIIAMLQDMPATLYIDRKLFLRDLKKAQKKHDLKLSAGLQKVVLSALGERDDSAEICRDKQGNPEPDGNLRDYEYVPLGEDVWVYFEREVLPHVPDAWINEDVTDHKDGKIGKVGYEINFNRYFYTYEPPRPLEAIEADIKKLEAEILELLRGVTK